MIPKKLSIIIPIYNEKRTISEVLGRVRAVEMDLEKEIIVVDDGSTDGTTEILKALDQDQNKIIFKSKNEGKGAALRDGMASATGDLVVFQDADLEYSPEDYPLLISRMADDMVGAVYGSRNLNAKNQGYWHYVLGVKVLSGVTNLLYGSKLTDVYTCYKMIRRDVWDKLEIKSSGFEIEAEITSNLLKMNFPIAEVAISYNPRTFDEGKKINYKDGLIGLWTILKNRIS